MCVEDDCNFSKVISIQLLMLIFFYKKKMVLWTPQLGFEIFFFLAILMWQQVNKFNDPLSDFLLILHNFNETPFNSNRYIFKSVWSNISAKIFHQKWVPKIKHIFLNLTHLTVAFYKTKIITIITMRKCDKFNKKKITKKK